MKRVFVAINLPEEVKRKLEVVKQEIVASFPAEVGDRVGKWVPENNLHITLLFIGEVKDEQLPKICDKVKQATRDWQRFKVELEKVCYGAMDKGVPKLIWAEAEENKNLECIAKNLGNQRFNGHITLARIKQLVWQSIEPDERPDIEQELNIEFEVGSVDIMESQLKRTGPEYSILQSIKLC